MVDLVSSKSQGERKGMWMFSRFDCRGVCAEERNTRGGGRKAPDFRVQANGHPDLYDFTGNTVASYSRGMQPAIHSRLPSVSNGVHSMGRIGKGRESISPMLAKVSGRGYHIGH